MNNDLAILTLACDSLKDLKYREGMYKRAALITASDSLARLKNAGFIKYAGVGTLIAIPTAILAGWYLKKHHNRIRDDVGLGLNRLNSNWGIDAVGRVANSGYLSPTAREDFITSRIGTAADSQFQRELMDNALRSKKIWYDTMQARYRGLNRGNNVINNVRRDANFLYNNSMAGYPGSYTVGPAWGYGSNPAWGGVRS